MQSSVATANECAKLLETIGYKVQSEGERIDLNKDEKTYSITILGKSDKPHLIIPVKAVDVMHTTIQSVKTPMVGLIHNEIQDGVVTRYMYAFKTEDLKTFAEGVYSKFEDQGMIGFTDSTENDNKRIHVHYKGEGYIGCLHLNPEILTNNVRGMKQHLCTVQEKSAMLPKEEKNETVSTDDDLNW